MNTILSETEWPAASFLQFGVNKNLSSKYSYEFQCYTKQKQCKPTYPNTSLFYQTPAYRVRKSI